MSAMFMLLILHLQSSYFPYF